MSSSSMCRRPAESTMTTSYPRLVASAHRAFRARDRIHLPGRVVDADAEPGLLGDDVQLLNRRRPFDVGRHEQGVLALLGQPLRQLARGRRLAGALQPQQQDHARPLARRLQSALGIAEERDHFVAHDLDDLLRGRQAAQHILPQRPIADPIDECLDDLEVDVGFEQREPDLAKRRLDVLGRQPRLAPQGLEDVLQAVTERVKHLSGFPGFQGSGPSSEVRVRRQEQEPCKVL